MMHINIDVQHARIIAEKLQDSKYLFETCVMCILTCRLEKEVENRINTSLESAPRSDDLSSLSCPAWHSAIIGERLC